MVHFIFCFQHHQNTIVIMAFFCVQSGFYSAPPLRAIDLTGKLNIENRHHFTRQSFGISRQTTLLQFCLTISNLQPLQHVLLMFRCNAKLGNCQVCPSPVSFLAAIKKHWALGLENTSSKVCQIIVLHSLSMSIPLRSTLVDFFRTSSPNGTCFRCYHTHSTTDPSDQHQKKWP